MNTELMTGFIIWLAGGGLLTALGVGAFFFEEGGGLLLQCEAAAHARCEGL